MKLLMTVLVLIVSVPAGVGAVSGAALSPHETPATALFSSVPPGGYPDNFPYGWCTWWAAYNHRVTWNGNAGDWLANAQAQGVPTTDAPSVGAIVVYKPGGPYSDLGHVAIVIAEWPGDYSISEMYFIGFGRVNTRLIPWPDPHVEGFIP